MKLVVVESPAKAKTINKYLGKDYQVEASYGHICDLPSKKGSVIPEQDFLMKYEISSKSVNQVKKLCQIASKADEIILATDPDREGEAISWHVAKTLEEQHALKPGVKISRVAFNEITKKAVQAALAEPRAIDDNLVNAQQARRALDYLVGFNLSPVLWRKLPGAKSAGRVQSVALRLICEREAEIERFKTQEYWDITADFKGASAKAFSAKLTHKNDEKLDKFAIKNKEEAEKLADELQQRSFYIDSLDTKQQQRSPAPPFTTSTLQQEAARKLGFSAKKTMQIAQKLYEGVDVKDETIGLITYMRTDGVSIAGEAVSAAREYIASKIGKDYLPASPKIYKAKAKNAQEAHEAIRPTNIALTPDEVKAYLEKDLFRLYELIWKRTIACQMANAELETAIAEINSTDKVFKLRATGTIIKFDGFYRLYREGIDEQNEDEESKNLPPLTIGEALNLLKIDPRQHFTEPPPRFSEASLVKKLEELGIGRPSTYANILSVIQDREYVKLEKKRFIPEERGRLVTVFLVEFFKQYVEYEFTAELEEDLDKIAEGKIEWKTLLHRFWEGFNQNVGTVSEKRNAEIIDSLNELLADHLFPKTSENIDPRKCTSCGDGTLGLRLGKFGAFIACSNYPTCQYRKSISAADTSTAEEGSEEVSPVQNDNKLLGTSKNGEEIWLKKGPYGYYVQLGEAAAKGEKPKRASLPPGYNPETIPLEVAQNLLSLPIALGKHPETSEEISIGIGKFGPYVKCGNKFTSIPKNEDPFAINLSQAIQVIKDNVKVKK